MSSRSWLSLLGKDIMPKKLKRRKKKKVPIMKRVLSLRHVRKLCHCHQVGWHKRQSGMKKQEHVNCLFNKIHSLCKSPSSCYLDSHSYRLGGGSSLSQLLQNRFVWSMVVPPRPPENHDHRCWLLDLSPQQTGRDLCLVGLTECRKKCTFLFFNNVIGTW